MRLGINSGFASGGGCLMYLSSDEVTRNSD